MKNTNSLLTSISFTLFFLMCFYGVINLLIKEPFIGIRKNISDSLPYSYFISTKDPEPERGIYITLVHPRSNIPLAKQIVGLPGDFIKVIDQTIFINDNFYGEIKQYSPCGTPMTPIQEGIIPQGYLFVHASHPHSFDSRYAEFGLIENRQVKEKLWPLF